MITKAHQLRGKGKKHKYGAKSIKNSPSCHDGYRSKLEARMAEMLRLRERAGEIKNIRREQSMQLTPSVCHKLDFIVFDVKRGMDIGIEAKGAVCPTWAVKQNLYRDFGPFPVQVWVDERGRLAMQKEIPAGAYTIAPL